MRLFIAATAFLVVAHLGVLAAVRFPALLFPFSPLLLLISYEAKATWLHVTNAITTAGTQVPNIDAPLLSA